MYLGNIIFYKHGKDESCNVILKNMEGMNVVNVILITFPRFVPYMFLSKIMFPT